MSESPEEPAPSGAAPETGAPSGAAPARRAGWRSAVALLLLVVLAGGLLAWQHLETRGELAALRQEVARRIAEGGDQAKESRAIAQQAREALADVQERLGALERRVAESQSQQVALEALYQELSRNRDEWAYAEIEQSLVIASQQLALAGNIRAALIALQSAEARLGRLNRPADSALRSAISRDIERLKAAPHADATALAARLEAIVAQVDGLPLAMDARPQPPGGSAPEPPAEVWWRRLWRETWSEIRELVRVQRVDGAEPPLIAPDQAYFLRENLKLRLLGARLALLARDPAAFRADLQGAAEWLARYFDRDSNAVADARDALARLREAEIAIQPPGIEASLEAMRGLRAARENPGAQ